MQPIFTFLISFFIFTSISFAIENADTFDYVGQFKLRAKPLEQNIEARAGASAAEIFGLYNAYYLFLDEELTKAYNDLLKKLPKLEQKKLKSSQKAWQGFRDSEFNFITAHWASDKLDKMASTKALSVGVYKSELVKQRIVHLFNYLKN